MDRGGVRRSRKQGIRYREKLALGFNTIVIACDKLEAIIAKEFVNGEQCSASGVLSGIEVIEFDVHKSYGVPGEHLVAPLQNREVISFGINLEDVNPMYTFFLAIGAQSSTGHPDSLTLLSISHSKW